MCYADKVLVGCTRFARQPHQVRQDCVRGVLRERGHPGMSITSGVVRLFLSVGFALFGALAGAWAVPGGAGDAKQGWNVEYVGQIGGGTFTVAVQDNYAYIGVGPNFTIVDVSNSARPAVTGMVLLPDIVQGVAVAGSVAYVADSNGGLQVIDVSDPANPALLGSWSYDTLALGYACDVAVSGSVAYVAGGASGSGFIHILTV